MNHSESTSIGTTTSPQRLPRSTALSYSVGQLALNVTYTSIGVYLTFFYTDVVKLAPTLVASVFLISFSYDALAAPFMGHISDRMRWKYGRRRPFFGFGALPMAVAFLFIFSPHYFSSGIHPFVYLIVTILLLFTFRTVVETPFIAMLPELTLDYNDRTRVSAFRQMFATGGDIIGSMGPLVLVELTHSEINAYAVFGVIAALLIVTSLLTAYRGTSERGQYAKSALSLVSAFKATLTNKPYLILITSLTLTIIANSTATALMLYIAKYWFLSEALTKYFMAAFFVGVFASIPFWIKLSEIIEKKTAYIIDMTVYGFILCVILFLRQDAHVAAVLVMGVAGFFNVGLWILSGSLSADVIELDQLRTGERREGSYAGVAAFASKACQGIGLALVNVALGFIGYVPNVPQSPSTLLKFKIIYGPLPAAIFWLAAFVLLFYPITGKVHKQMLEQLAARTQATEPGTP